MDHATLTDNTGRKADFRNIVLILTSNAGSREMSARSIGFADGVGSVDEDVRGRTAAGKAKTAIERVFSPEFRNRLDAIVTFKPLTPEAMETIVEKFILQLESQLADRHVAITLTPEARSWLATEGYDRVFGARPLARVIQKEVRDLLDRSDSVRRARARRHRDDRRRGRAFDIWVRIARDVLTAFAKASASLAKARVRIVRERRRKGVPTRRRPSVPEHP